ncbi:hypothetical protein KKC13_04880 [bacterium]|nr:hypothetical protein [bacterium]MBU1959320.1 hypothetical protein [bacterium]
MKFYMQIHRSNLADYISKAMIVPTKYIENRTEEDIQSKNKDFILLSDGYFDTLTDNQILLEIVLAEEEIQVLESISLTVNTEDKIYACNVPLPITRIRQIYIANKEIISQYQSIFNIGDVGYFPSERFTILTKSFNKKLKQYQIPFTVRNKIIKWLKISKESKLYPYKPLLVKNKKNQEKLLKYDKILGLFAFIKNTNFYFANRGKCISNYSDYYFILLGQLNNKIEVKEIDEKKLKFLKELLQIEETSFALIEKLYKKEQIDDGFIKDIANKNENEKLLLELFDEMTKMEALKSLQNTKDFHSAYLYINRFDGDMESLKFKIQEIEKIDRAEILLAMFGLYYGYSKIRAREAIEIEDDVFKNLLIDKREKNIKFMLDSKLDYITIESIYQYVFNDKISNGEFEYLEYPKYKPLKIILNKKITNWYIIERKRYFDVELITLSTNDWKTIITNILEKYGKKITPVNSGLFKFLYQNQKKTIKISMKENEFEESFIYKEEVEEFILNIDDEKKRNQLFDAFRLDKK